MIPIQFGKVWINPKKIAMIQKDNQHQKKTIIYLDNEVQVQVDLTIEKVLAKLAGKIP